MRTLLAVALVSLPALAGAQRAWKVKEDLRIGSMDEGPSLFADVRAVAADGRGNIYVFEYKTQDIRVFDASGQFVRRIGRTGSGPGEMRSANGMLMAPDGRLWVNDPGNSRFNVFEQDGKSAATHTLGIRGYGYRWTAMFDTAGVLYDMVFLPKQPPDPTVAVRRVRPNGSVLDTIPLAGCAHLRETTYEGHSKTSSAVTGIPFVPTQLTVWDPRGFLWCAPGDSYEVLELRMGRGDTVRRITKSVPPVPVTSTERDAEIEKLKKIFARYPDASLDFTKIPKVKPPLVALDLDDRGNLWVRRTTSDSLTATYDVFDSRGTNIATAELPWRLSAYNRLAFRRDYVYGITRDEDDVPYVVRARISR